MRISWSRRLLPYAVIVVGCVVIILVNRFMFWRSIPSQDDARNDPQLSGLYADPLEQSRFLYNFGFFMDGKQMDSEARWIVERNARVSGLPYIIIGPSEAERDLAEAEQDVPGITAAYESVPVGVARSDICRLVSVYVRGGFYLDLDVYLESRPPISKIFADVYVEHIAKSVPTEGVFGEKYTTRMANFAFSAPPKHPFFREVLQEVARRCRVAREQSLFSSDKAILWITGPDVITNVAHETNSSHVVRIHDPKVRSRMFTHLYDGSWRTEEKGTIRGKWLHNLLVPLGLRWLLGRG
uniref:Alpha 1,4-glycosyltransferase domain-containing protein n=1 Tax=Chromera velia CCMP2878 TaxID=1169474 RepID=A0A0G4G8I6_9ALVE|eukprot:Cvel_20771.t1-p1 / transcript=Cvel_20771.t1 / gene=Cvel_20771 / organism=Chromera_velia_CCMP2878 / gene_product=hypothetical protein / transcript_product=hypothetical protein / location=Cvel_scaffold1895:6648-7622(-) / protein_length=296 / sequence_SO=supercontig / SO=protein_coding / is_pseudo=false